MPLLIAKKSSHSVIGRLRKWPPDARHGNPLPVFPGLGSDFISHRSSYLDLRELISGCISKVTGANHGRPAFSGSP